MSDPITNKIVFKAKRGYQLQIVDKACSHPATGPIMEKV